jgi:hypothetical protein
MTAGVSRGRRHDPPVMSRTGRAWLLAVGLLAGGCATARRGEVAAPAAGGRVPDSVEARVAGLRAADPNQHAEDDDRRWGTPEARQRKQERARQARQKAAGQPGKPADVVKTGGR